MACLSFVGLTVLLLAVPSLMVVLLGKRANDILPKMRDWMNQNAWVVSEIVLVVPRCHYDQEPRHRLGERRCLKHDAAAASSTTPPPLDVTDSRSSHSNIRVP